VVTVEEVEEVEEVAGGITVAGAIGSG